MCFSAPPASESPLSAIIAEETEYADDRLPRSDEQGSFLFRINYYSLLGDANRHHNFYIADSVRESRQILADLGFRDPRRRVTSSILILQYLIITIVGSNSAAPLTLLFLNFSF